MSGTTDGSVYALTVDEQPHYILKIDSERDISLVSQLHEAYSKSPLLSKFIYTDPSNGFLVYSYISGTTHYNRGSKLDWMARIVKVST